MTKLTTPPPVRESSIPGNEAMVAMNEALILGSVRQHELTADSDAMNARLEVEIAVRKRSEDALRISEVRFRRLFEAAGDGVLLVDPESAKITDANSQMTQLSGRPQDQLVGKPLWEIGFFGNLAESRQLIANLETTLEIRIEELPLDHLDGRQQMVEVVANYYRENGHSVIQINIRDITERKRAEAILRRNELLFTAIIELAPVGVFVADAELRLRQVNPNAMPIFKDIHPLIGHDFAEVMQTLWGSPTADDVIARFRHTLETGETYRSPEFNHQRKDTGDQEVYDWEIQGVTLPAGGNGVVCYYNNITERKNDEAALRTLAVLTASNVKLKKEIVRRKAVEVSLHQTQQEQIQLLDQSRKQEEQLRDLSRRILHTQEDERNRISRELHDVISQNLIGLNVSISSLAKGDPAADPANFRLKIASTQRIVEESVKQIHHFARELRPTLLDDLGLIPALHSHLKSFMKETGIRSSLTVFAGIEQVNGDMRTALYRIAQEALANVARHAKANQVAVGISTLDGVISMEIKDDGIGFEVAGNSHASKKSRLGLIGMKERIEMVGGCFEIISLPGQGTTVRVAFTNSPPSTP